MKTFAKIVGIPILLLVLLTGCKSQNTAAAEARLAAQDFYGHWTDTSDTRPAQDRYANDAVVSANLRAKLNAMQSDNLRVSSILCGQNVPSSVDIPEDASVVSNGTATVTVNEHFGTQVVPVQVSVRQGTTGNWQIDDVVCPNGMQHSSMSSTSSMMQSSALSTSSVSSTMSSRSASNQSSSAMSTSSRGMSSSATSADMSTSARL